MRARSVLATALSLAAAVGAGGLAAAGRAQSPQTTPAPAAQCATAHWVATWTAPPSGSLGSGLSNQTLRIILTPHVGAPALRVHLSNRFGSKPVTFARATVALRQSGAALVAGSSRPLTFAGQAGVTVPAGGEAISDPAVLTFGAFQDLAVSLYLADPTGPPTGHYIARERSYSTGRTSGDHTADDAAGAFAGTSTSVQYVDAVDGLTSTAVGAAVVLGDSITDGYEFSAAALGEDLSEIDANHRLPDFIQRRLLAQPNAPGLSVLNGGISGNRLLVDGQIGLAGASGISRANTDVLAVSGVTDAIVFEGINDVASLATASQVEGALGQIVSHLHAAGLHVQLGTLIPAGRGLLNLGDLLPTVFIGGPADGVRVAVNEWIRSGASGADGVVDFDAAVRGAISNELDGRYDSGDHVHPNDAGYSKMADVVNLAMLRGSQCAAAPVRAAARLSVKVRALPRGRLSVRGSLLGAGGDCTGTAVTVKTLRAGRTLSRRHLGLTAACQFAANKPIGARGRIEVRISFAGSATVLPARARAIFVRTR